MEVEQVTRLRTLDERPELLGDEFDLRQGGHREGLQPEVRDVEEGIANSEHEVLAHAHLELRRPGVGQRLEPEMDDQAAQGPIRIAIEPDAELTTGAAQVRDDAIGVDASTLPRRRVDVGR